MPAGDEPLQRISALTLKTADMARSVAFYQALSFRLLYGGPEADFTSFAVGSGYLNLQLDPAYRPLPIWGRVIFWVDDVDAMYERAVTGGCRPETEPADGPWGERYFHLRDPDGHELSFAQLVSSPPSTASDAPCRLIGGASSRNDARRASSPITPSLWPWN